MTGSQKILALLLTIIALVINTADCSAITITNPTPTQSSTGELTPVTASSGVLSVPPTYVQSTVEYTSGGAIIRTSNLLGTFSITINAGPGLAGNAAALAAFNRAADQWAARIRDPITVEIDADLAALGPGIIGSTSSAFVSAGSPGGYDIVRNAMVADAAAEADDAIVASLPTSGTFNAIVPVNITGIDDEIVLTKANAKALGFGTPVGADAAITFSTNFSFDYDNSNGVGAGQVDFETVASHEIGHALGFVSVVDVVDFAVDQGLSGTIAINPLDLFRFNFAGANPSTAGEFATFDRELRANVEAVTDDIDNEYRMSTGSDTGDGRQASHWKDDDLGFTRLGQLDPTLPNSTIWTISPADFRAFDLIGYDIGNDSVITAPANLNLGSVLVGSTHGDSVDLTKSGIEGTTYTVGTTSTLQQTSDGVIGLNGQIESITLSLQGTETAGAFAATATIDNTAYDFYNGGDGSQDPNDSINVTATVLDHSEASFNNVSDVDSLLINFGSVQQNSLPLDQAFSITNLVSTASFTAGLDLDSINGIGDTGVLTTNLATFSNQAAGTFSNFLASFDTSNIGTFSVTYTLGVSDQNLPGAIAGTNLLLTLTGEVVAAATFSGIPEPSSATLVFGLVLVFTAHRRRKAR